MNRTSEQRDVWPYVHAWERIVYRLVESFWRRRQRVWSVVVTDEAYRLLIDARAIMHSELDGDPEELVNGDGLLRINGILIVPESHDHESRVIQERERAAMGGEYVPDHVAVAVCQVADPDDG